MDRPFPPEEADRQGRGNLGPSDGILHQIVSSLPFTNEDFPGSWVDQVVPPISPFPPGTTPNRGLLLQMKKLRPHNAREHKLVPETGRSS